MADRIQLRRDTAANWTAYNPILLEGEPGIELNTDQWKMGDGIHNWNDLPYRGGEVVQQKGQSTTVAMSQKAVSDELDKIDRNAILYSNYISRLDLSSYTPANGYILSNGKWSQTSSSNRKHIVIPISDLGITKDTIEIFAGENNCIFAQLSSYNPIDDSSDLVPGSSRLIIQANGVYRFKLLQEATYLYFQYNSGGLNYLPEQIVINDPLANNYLFKGFADINTVPTVQQGTKICYIAKASGNYSNFGLNIHNSGLTLLMYNGETWSSSVLSKPKFRLGTNITPNIDTANHVLDLGGKPIIILETADYFVNIVLYTELDDPTIYRSISLLASSGRYGVMIFNVYNLSFSAFTRSQELLPYHIPFGIYDSENPEGCSYFDFPVTYDGYKVNYSEIRNKPEYDSEPSQGSVKILKSTTVRESERKLNEYILGNSKGSIFNSLHFTKGRCSTAKNVPEYSNGDYSRLIGDFIACNQHENAKLVVTNHSNEPELKILVGLQKGTNNYNSLGGFKTNESFEVSLNGADRDRLYILIAKTDDSNLTIEDINGIDFVIEDIVIPVDETDILNLNPEKIIVPRLINLNRPYRVYGNGATRNCLTLLHLSDLHADNENLDRIKTFATKYSSYIGDIIQTGDLFDYRNGLPSSYTADTNIINTIGNHEARYKVNGEYVYPTTLELYNLIYKDFIDRWNVTQPADAATEGKCYFYKDYASVYVRLLVIDCMHFDSAQQSWMQSVLSDAITQGYHIIAAIHISPLDTVKDVNNPFSSIEYSPGNAGGVRPGPEALIKTFIDNGGHFVCYLCGHIHDDFMGVGVANDYNNQLVIGVGSASTAASGNYSSMARIRGDKTQDCFNILSIDTQTCTLKLMRVGANYDRFMRQKNTLAWDYDNSRLIYAD